FFRSLQKASSKLTLVLCPSMTMDRLTIQDFIKPPYPCILHTTFRSREKAVDCPANPPFRDVRHSTNRTVPLIQHHKNRGLSHAYRKRYHCAYGVIENGR